MRCISWSCVVDLLVSGYKSLATARAPGAFITVAHSRCSAGTYNKPVLMSTENKFRNLLNVLWSFMVADGWFGGVLGENSKLPLISSTMPISSKSFSK